MSGFVNTLDLLGDTTVVDSIIEGTLEEFQDNVLNVIGKASLADCEKLKYVVLTNVTELKDYAFIDCKALDTLILSSENICVLRYSALSNTPIASGTGYIYVPRALLDTYKTATNWSTYANQFRALEDYTVDGTVTGELDESKI